MTTVDIEITDDEADDFFTFALNGVFNLNWESDDRAVLTLTPWGKQILMRACEETIADDPVDLVEYRAHNHDYDPSCREKRTIYGNLRGECLDTEPPRNGLV